MAEQSYGDWIRSNPPLPTKEYKHMAQQTAVQDLIIALQKFKKSRMVCQVTIDAAIEFAATFLEMELEPIELPSDKEIEQEAHIQYPVNLQPNGRTLSGGRYDIDINYSERNAYILSAKWMRDKIQGGNK